MSTIPAEWDVATGNRRFDISFRTQYSSGINIFGLQNSILLPGLTAAMRSLTAMAELIVQKNTMGDFLAASPAAWGR